MQFRIDKATLTNMIQTVSKAVAVRTTKQVLSGILLDVSNTELTATAYDLELGIQNTIQSSDNPKLHVDIPGSIVLPARYFSDVIRKLPHEDISIHVNNNYMTSIQSGNAEFHLHGIDAAEFPKLPSFLGSESVSISSDALRELIRSTAFATSNSEVRPVLTGIYLQLKNDILSFTATDGLRLATRSVTLPDATGQEWTAVLPGKPLNELIKLLPEQDAPVTVQFTPSHSLFAIGNTFFYTRLISGTYPDTSRLIPSSHQTEVHLPADDFLGAIDRAALIARDRDNHMVRLEIASTSLTVSSSSPEIGNVSETTTANTMEGNDLSIAFNAKYVLDALRALSAAEISILFNGGNHPFVMRRLGDNQGLQLIMPVLTR